MATEAAQAPYVPGLDYNIDLPRLQQLLRELADDSPLRSYIEREIIGEYSNLPEQWSFNQTLEEFRRMGECDNFYDTDTPTEDDLQYAQWYYDWVDELWAVIYLRASEADRRTTLYQQLQTFLEVFIHSPWNISEYAENCSFPDYSFKEAWLVYYLITHGWSHVNNETRNIPQHGF